jgi:hypothetical protein
LDASLQRAVRPPRVLLLAFVLGVVALVLVGRILLTSGSQASAGGMADVANAPAASETVSVGAPTAAPPIAKGFLGFSVEYQSIAVDAGSASDPDTVLDRLVTALNPGGRPVIRIGGDSTDHTWYPVAGVDNPGLTYALTPAWLASVRTFASATDAKLILGIDLEVDDPQVAEAEARALLDGIGTPHILRWEIGNEPNLYASFPWYLKVAGNPDSGFFTRPRSYSFDQYLQDVDATALTLPDVPLAGPALGSPAWMAHLPQMLAAEPNLRTVTYHAYPLNCYAKVGNPAYPSIPDLLANTASEGLAASVAGFATEARAAGRQFRVDELNTSACGGSTGVSDAFASALWATDTLFAMASKGVSGVNIQTFNSSRYKPFAFSRVNGHWVAQVEPMYYGLRLFAEAAPAGSRLLRVRTTGAKNVRGWAAQTPAAHGDSHPGPETVTLINDNPTHAETLNVRVPDTRGGTLVRMRAPSVRATGGVTLAGTSYGSSTSTGRPTGATIADTISPGAKATYEVSLPPASAALLTLRRR